MKGEDVWEFLANLCYKREDLAAAGVSVTDDEYKHIILQGIPGKLMTFVLHLLSLALIVHSTSKIDLDTLINLL